MIVLLDLKSIMIAAVLFFAGYLIGPYLYKKRIKIFTAYPVWFSNKLIHFISRKKLKFVLLLPFIFSFNSFSLFTILISSIVAFLPIFLIFWLGINLGISITHISRGKNYWKMLLNPVSILELSASFITGGASIQFNLNHTQIMLKIFGKDILKFLTLNDSIAIYLHFTLPILAIAAIIESSMIILYSRYSSGTPDKN